MTTQDVNPRDALDAAIDAAVLADPIIETKDGRTFVMLPDSHSARDISDPNRLPPHIKQSLTFDDRDSTTNYINRFSDGRSIILASYDSGTISARLDWHKDKDAGLEPQQGNHTATLKLKDSEEYARWSAMEGEMHAQKDFARFIEENVADVLAPDHNVMLEVCRDLEVMQGTSFKSGVRLENGDRTFVYQTDTQVKGDIRVPTELTLDIPLYHGEPPSQVQAKFRFKPTQDGLMLGFVWHRVEYRRQAVFREMAHKIAEDTALPVYYGRA